MASTDEDGSVNPSMVDGSPSERPESAEDLKQKLQNGGSGEPVKNHISSNGVSNHSGSGDRSSKYKDKHREHSSSKSKDHHSSSSKHSSSSSSKDKHRDGSSKHKDGSSSSKHHSSSSSKHKDGHSSSSSKHRDGHSSSKDKHHSSSSKDKHSSSSDKHRDRHKDGHKSSSSSSDKHKSSSSSDKHKSSSSSNDKHKSSSSSHGDKHKSSSSSPDKHRSKDGHKETSKNKEHSSSHREKTEKHDKPKIKVEEGMCDVEMKVEWSPVKQTMKSEPLSDNDDMPLSVRIKEEPKAVKRSYKEESSDDEPLSSRMEKVAKKVKTEEKIPKKRKADSDNEEEFRPEKKKKKDKLKKKIKTEASPSPTKRVKKEKAPEPEVWKWWEEDRKDDGTKWKFLEHKGPVFAPAYEPLPKSIKFYYDGKEMALSEGAEEVATFYARMLDHDYTTRDVFNTNFMKDWRKMMTPKEKEIITDIRKCNFKDMAEYFKLKSEERKAMSKEEKLENKKKNEAMVLEYGFCTIDGHKEKIGNFKIEPPGLFRGRGDHPKQGMLKRRVQPEDVIINCSKNSEIPQPPAGHKWKEVRHDNSVTWLSSWNENIQGQTKYIMLNAASKLKGEKDWQKYEVARRLHKCVDKIRAQYHEDWKSKEMRIRQRAVALYFIDKLALRAGNEKEDGETADTVGCCSLRVEHVTLHDTKDGKECVVEFDFLGKDSIRYNNSVPVEKRVYKNLQLFMDNKHPGDDLFDRLNTAILNKHLHDLMEGLTAKVFRTYNASRTLQEQLDILTNPDDTIPAKILSYNRANRSVAILCNHQRAAPKTFAQSMENLQKKIEDKKLAVKDAKKAVKDAKSDYKAHNTEKTRQAVEKRKKALKRMEEQLTKLEVQATDKEENKEIALGTSKLNYLDPRISIAWCKKWDVPIEKIYNKTQRDKFRWAIDMATADFVF